MSEAVRNLGITREKPPAFALLTHDLDPYRTIHRFTEQR